jgi:hypothetical protein
MKHTILSSFIAFIALFIVSTASAQNPKSHGPVRANDKGQTLEVCFDISGLGNVTEVQMTLTYDATVYSECFNPGNRDESVPAHNKVVPGNSIPFTVPVRNGRATDCFTAEQTFTPGSCPNPNWTAVVTDVSFSNVKLTILGKTFVAQF